MASPEAEWHQALGQAVSALEMPDFPAALVAALHHVAVFDYCVIFGYAGSSPPADLHDDFGPRRRDIFVSVYQSGPYLLDPFYHASRQRIAGMSRPLLKYLGRHRRLSRLCRLGLRCKRWVELCP